MIAIDFPAGNEAMRLDRGGNGNAFILFSDRTMQQTLEDLTRLVSFQTVSGMPPERDMANAALIDWAADELDALGFAVTLIEVADGKKDLFAQLGGSEDAFTGLMLAGHTDTVDCDAGRWSSDPWCLSVRDGKAYGLGACDMKGFHAVSLGLARRLVFEGIVPKQGLALCMTSDEETSMEGARAAREYLTEKNVHPALTVVGEPTELAPIFGHKGYMGLRARITGKSAHSSNPALGINAIKTAGRFIECLNGFESRLTAAVDEEFAAGAEPGIPPYPTLNLGAIAGGDSVNRVCSEVRLDFDVRPMVTFNAAAVHRTLAMIADSVSRQGEGCVTLEPLYPDIPPFMNRDRDLQKAVSAVCGKKPQYVAYCTEAGFFESLGPVVVCGPGSIRQAHGIDEFVAVPQLEQAGKILDALAKAYAL